MLHNAHVIQYFRLRYAIEYLEAYYINGTGHAQPVGIFHDLKDRKQ